MPSYKNNRCYEAEEVRLILGLNEIDQVQCSTQQQRALGCVLKKITGAANEALTTKEALQICLESVCCYTEWAVGHACLIDVEYVEPSKSAHVWHLASHKKCRLEAETTKIESLCTLLGRILKERSAIYIADLWRDPRFYKSQVARKIGLRAGAAFPIWIGNEIRGVLEFFSDQEMKLDATLLQFLSNFGTQLGRLADHTGSEQSVPSLSALLLRTQDTERRRIARELHDSAGQSLAAIKMKLCSALKAVNDRPEISSELVECCDLVSECLKEIRTTSHLLHPPLLDELGLAATVRSYVQGYAQRSGIDVKFNIDTGLGRLGRDVEMAFFRVIQEALTNIHRHSGSPTARITIGRSISETFVEIADSGKGLPNAMAGPHGCFSGGIGVGIAGMRERIKELNGGLEIVSTAAGTVIRAAVPRRETRKAAAQLWP
jgi:signal transduction histidine kinase